ncbi:hypothetical protein FQR65_LT06662 [Abscondita terminalis]|nr:hypothetical protein FQR65_LT06662 [Abscondita terminalis]
MDTATTTTESTRKNSFDNLSKDEIIKKYQDLIQILKKAINNKETLIKENNELKEKLEHTNASAKDELVENLTSQKLSLVTNLEDLKSQNDVISSKYSACETRLFETETKLSELDIENQSLKRQTQRLVEDNEQLLKHLDCLEKQLKENNLHQIKQDALEIEKKNVCDELMQKEKIIGDLQTSNVELTEKYNELKANIETLEKNYQNAEIVICELRATVKESTAQREIYLSESDDLNIELHKNKALVEKLQQDLKTVSSKLTDNQIELSGYTSDLQNTNEKLKDKLKQFHTKIIKLATDVKVLKQHKINILDSFKSYNEQVRTWEVQLKQYSEKIVSEFGEVQIENSKLKVENNTLNGLISSKEEQLHSLSAHQTQMLEEQTSLLKQLEELKAKHIELEEKIKCSEDEKLVQSKKETTETSIQVNTIEEQITSIKKENLELLGEMNEMNQALKTRGEVISQQEEYCGELMSKIKERDTVIKDQLDALQQRDEKISNLENSISALRSNSETRKEEIDNNQEILAKKEAEIGQLHKEIAQLQEKLDTSQSLDASQDVSYAESETMSTSTISKTEEYNRIKDLEGSWEERYSKLRTLALKLKSKVRDLTTELNKERHEKLEVQQKLSENMKSCHTLHTQCDTLQDELDENKDKVKEHLRKLDAAALEISNTKKHLADNDETITKLKSEIDVLQKEKTSTDTWKKQISVKVQSLRKEIEAHNLLKKDFENQISKLNQQLDAKDKLLKEEIEKHNYTRNSLQESNIECKKQTVLNLEIQDYERSLKDLTQKLEKKQELINKLKNQIDNQKGAVSNIKEENKGLEEQLQTTEKLHASAGDVSPRKRDLSSQLSKVVAENQKSYSSLKTEKDYLRGQIMGLEQKLREVTDNLRLKEEEVNEISKEYHGYKVRAQSVLRQNQNRDVGLEEKLLEEVNALKTRTSTLTSELKELRSNLEKRTEENSKLNAEKETSLKKNTELENTLTDLHKQQESLCAKQQKTITEHAEAIRGLKVHAETLAQCYRQQLSEQEVRHNREIIELQSKLEKGTPTTDLPSLPPPISSREQGEGSENVEGNYALTHPIPLNQLLNYESDQEVGFLKKQMNDNEAKITHLTALLADTEQDLAKHVQMNKLLKEEIRRQQRSVEREKHAENLEYLKNVVFKFATLSSGDERSRLVPVLNTILKFSPEEIHKLNIVARNEMGNRGWSNYIPMWSSRVDSLRTSLISVATTHISCPVCNELLLGLDKLTIHLFSHITNNKIVQSDPNECVEKVECCTSAEVQIVPEEENPFKCDICDFRFSDSTILELHQQLLHQNPINKQTKYNYNCHLCQKQFRMRGSLMVHLRVAHFSYIQSNYKKLNIIDADDVTLKQSTDKRKCVQDKNWECDVCSKLFTTKYFLKKHKRLHTGEMPYYCAQCNKYFTFQQSYHKHMLYHTDNKPHVCVECGRAFKELSTLHNHERIHSGERPFSCETCGKSFRQRVSYLVHCRIHTGAMPYKCTACNKSFRYKISQRSHKCTADPPGSIVRKPDLVEKLKRKNQAATTVEQSSASDLSQNYLDTNSTFQPTKENLDFFNLMLSPVLTEVQSLCLSGYSESEQNSISHQEMNSLDTINDESFKELLYGLPDSS